MSDLINRQAAIELIHSLYPSAPIMRRNRERWEKKYKPYIEAEKALEMLPSAQPGTYEALRILDAINSSGRLDYSDYCDLHDAISEIGGAQRKGDTRE